MRHRYSLLATAVFLLSTLPTPAFAAPGELPGQWIEVRSEHFVVVSNARPKEVRKVAIHFEQIRQILAQEMPRFARASGPPLLIFAASNEKTMERLLWARRTPAGIFYSSPLDQFIVLRADQVGGEDFGVVYHEYFHFLATEAGLVLPPWLGEGLADYWGSGTRLTRKEAEVARAIDYRLKPLRDGKLMPLDVLFSVDHNSTRYRDRYKALEFYAQSWALTHYIMLGDESGRRKQQLVEYFALLGRKKSSLDAAREAFGDLETLRSELKVYVRQLTYSYFRLPLPAEPAAKTIHQRELPKGEAAALVARYLARGRSKAATEVLLKQAAADAADLAITQEARGIFHMGENQTTESLAAFERAAQADDASALSHYGAAIMRFHQARQNDSMTREVLTDIEAQLVSSLQRDRNFGPAAARLAEVYRRLDGERAHRALVAIRRAIELEPDRTEYRLLEARILRESGQEDPALEIIRQEAAAAEPQSEASTAAQLNSLCWRGTVLGFSDIVQETCEKAMEIEPECSSCLDSLAVAKALNGDLEGALADFKTALAGPDPWDETEKASREAWVAELEAGKNPFAERGYLTLADDPLHDGIGWLR